MQKFLYTDNVSNASNGTYYNDLQCDIIKCIVFGNFIKVNPRTSKYTYLKLYDGLGENIIKLLFLWYSVIMLNLEFCKMQGKRLPNNTWSLKLFLEVVNKLVHT